MKCDRVTRYFQDTVVYSFLFRVDSKINLFFIINWTQAVDIQINSNKIGFLEQMNASNIGINAIRISQIRVLNIGF